MYFRPDYGGRQDLQERCVSERMETGILTSFGVPLELVPVSVLKHSEERAPILK